MFSFSSFIRPNIRNLKPYSSARSEFSGQAQVLLDANESPYAWDSNTTMTIQINRYPDSVQKELRSSIAQMRNLKSENVFVGNGSDDIIDDLIRICCEPGIDKILVTPPTFDMYSVAAAINNVEVQKVTLDQDFQLDVASIQEQVTSSTKILFFCSPNNPTGNVMMKSDMITLCRSFPGLVVVDEAYIDYSEPAMSMLDQLGLLPNLLILQTFSKAWGLAGLRLGVALGSSEIIATLLKIKMPYNVNSLTAAWGVKVLSQSEQVKQQIRTTLQERNRIIKVLKTNPALQVFPTDANFILVRFPDANAVYAALMQKGVIVRNQSNKHGCENCLRITIGTREENDLLLVALQEIL